MSEKTRGRLYVAVCIACLITCAVLIGSIFFQNKQNAGQQTEIHRPRMDQMTTQQGEGGMQGMGETLITEEYAAGMLKKMLPADLPVENVRVAISGNGLVAVAATADRDGFRDYLQRCGVNMGLKGNLFLSMLPKQAPLVVAFRCTGGESGKIQLSPAALRVNGTELDPQRRFCIAVNREKRRGARPSLFCAAAFEVKERSPAFCLSSKAKDCEKTGKVI